MSIALDCFSKDIDIPNIFISYYMYEKNHGFILFPFIKTRFSRIDFRVKKIRIYAQCACARARARTLYMCEGELVHQEGTSTCKFDKSRAVRTRQRWETESVLPATR